MAIRSVLVTGGTGFVGSAIVDALIEKHPSCSITVLDLKVNVEQTKPCNVSYICGDILDPGSVADAITEAQPDVVIHTAGIVPHLSERYHRRIEKEVFEINVDGTRHVLNATKDAGISAFVYTSSCCCVIDDWSRPYANIDERWPMAIRSSIYGESKAAAERLVLAANSPAFSTCIIRPSVLMGPGDNQLIPPIHACIDKYETPFVIGSADNLWDITYVTNIADAHVLAAENLLSDKTAAGEAFFIQNNEPIPFRDFSLAVWKEFGHIPPFSVKIPKNLAWTVGFLAEVVSYLTGSKAATLSRGSVNDACAMRYASGAKAKRILGYEPRVGLEEGIRLSCEEYKRRLAGRAKLE